MSASRDDQSDGMELTIIFRSCSSVYSYHGHARVVDVPKSELLLTCFQSLVSAIQHASQNTSWRFRVVIIDDHSDETSLRELDRLRLKLPCESEVHALTKETGNGASLQACYEFAEQHQTSAFYFVEDDYLHTESALTEMIGAYTRFSSLLGQDVIVHPYDCPDRYAHPYPSMITLLGTRYWRTIKHTTGTFMVTKNIFMEYIDCYKAFAVPATGGILEDGTINTIYEHVTCVSPMPSLVVHMETPAHMPPFVPWQEWWMRACGEKDAQ